MRQNFGDLGDLICNEGSKTETLGHVVERVEKLTIELMSLYGKSDGVMSPRGNFRYEDVTFDQFLRRYINHLSRDCKPDKLIKCIRHTS